MRKLFLFCVFVLLVGGLEVVSAECVDSDGGKSFYIRGDIEYTAGPGIAGGSDECESSTLLDELYCDENNFGAHEYYECPNGCADGVCIEETITCIDSDGGIDYYVKGVASVDYFGERGDIHED